MDHCELTAHAFDGMADKYQANFMELSLYDESYREFCAKLKPGQARVLDAACGPGNVARFILAQRPELDLEGIDMAPRMVELARSAVAGARFRVHDCRELQALQTRFDGIVCAFGLPYLSAEEVQAFILNAAEILEPGGVVYLSLMLGDEETSELKPCSSGDQIQVYYHTRDLILTALAENGLELVWKHQLASPNGSAEPTTDLIVVASKPD